MKIPSPQFTTATAIDKAHEIATVNEKPRPHMGASQLGHPCDRYLWLQFRWAKRQLFSGRMLRLFRRGHLEERVIVSDLKFAGMTVTHTGQQQMRAKLGGHVSGSMDGIIESGVPEAPSKRHVLEMKTHNDKSFADLCKNGVRAAKFQHYVQMQLYMLASGIDRSLYVAVNKNDDSLYTERVRFDAELAERYKQRGIDLSTSDRMPPPLSNDPSYYLCKGCAFHSICFPASHTETERRDLDVNCRTCAFATARPDGTWFCEHWQAEIPLDAQYKGCDHHVLHTDLSPWQQGEAVDQWTATWLIDGRLVANGAPRKGVYSTAELLANPSACGLDNDALEAIRTEMGGRVVS